LFGDEETLGEDEDYKLMQEVEEEIEQLKKENPNMGSNQPLN
jgi:hypothetical protein